MDTMTLQRFRELADAWGADVTRWPVTAQPAAVRVLAGSDGDAARGILDAAAVLDAALQPSAPLAVPAQLRAAILASADATLADARSGRAGGGTTTLGYASEWFPRTTPAERDGRQAALRAAPGAAAARSGWARLWSELGGLRVAGPALAMALVAGVALAEVRDLGVPGDDAGALTASSEEVVEDALYGADYDEYML